MKSGSMLGFCISVKNYSIRLLVVFGPMRSKANCSNLLLFFFILKPHKNLCFWLKCRVVHMTNYISIYIAEGYFILGVISYSFPLFNSIILNPIYYIFFFLAFFLPPVFFFTSSLFFNSRQIYSFHVFIFAFSFSQSSSWIKKRLPYSLHLQIYIHMHTLLCK